MTSDPEDFLPLKPAAVHILMSLGREERYGYAIMKEVAERTRGRVKLQAGALYRSLGRLVDDGLVVELDERRVAAAGEDIRRRYYGLTPLGSAVLAAELERMGELSALGRAWGLC